MNKVKTIILIYENGSYKGYNLNAFKKVFKINLNEYLGVK